ncbi:Os07g0485201 [Oryza sativa Japonica Group]|uniref:Os07g0485201 protein n=1 Tax=Oryza sativa subsp. japonica TaxID=39947 RepID=A0A0P0X5T9_ORYSJ|nr:Os07g0485201 [Oryza sativa Japonica Group]
MIPRGGSGGTLHGEILKEASCLLMFRSSSGELGLLDLAIVCSTAKFSSPCLFLPALTSMIVIDVEREEKGRARSYGTSERSSTSAFCLPFLSFLSSDGALPTPLPPYAKLMEDNILAVIDLETEPLPSNNWSPPKLSMPPRDGREPNA